MAKLLDPADERYAIELGRTLFAEAYKIMATEAAKKPAPFAGLANLTFLSDSICTFVYRFVEANAQSGISADAAVDSYRLFKRAVEEAIALGFQTAMQKYSGKQVEYFTQIQVVPEPINKDYPC